MFTRRTATVTISAPAARALAAKSGIGQQPERGGNGTRPFFPSRVIRDESASDTFTNSGATRTYTGTVVDSSKPFRVTLAWTDAPGNTTGNAYNNNLDLTVTVGGQTLAFIVDELIGREEVVIKPLGTMLAGTKGLSGATITGDGRIALILDMPELIDAHARS